MDDAENGSEEKAAHSKDHFSKYRQSFEMNLYVKYN